MIQFYRNSVLCRWQMAFQGTGVVKDADYVHNTLAAAIDQEVAGLSDCAHGAPRPATAEV
jgi:hypothetical protein